MEKQALIELATNLLIIAGSITGSVFLVLSPFMYIVWWVRKNNIKKSEEALEANADKIEDITFFSKNKEYNKVIEELVASNKELVMAKKKLIDEIADLEKEKERKSKK